ncbi:cyanophycinase [Leucobacter aridicollis]|uniref:cyanophycinase n=1 Tax=Leucobacter aridicollis TaxID=283878 RepID=UPI002104AA25|nr:cyanophycinase [Leucobacter aridicollis]UTX53563.1 cyanophycinase [Leucobacter aridicollis]
MPRPAAPSATHAADATGARAGTLVLIGGALDEHPEIIRKIVALAGERRRTGAPRIAILTTASEPAGSQKLAQDPTAENDEADGRYYAELFARHGAVGVPIPIGVSEAPAYPGSSYSRAQADAADTAELIRSTDGVFLGGGDQTHYVLALFRATTPGAQPFASRTATPALTAILDVLGRGGVVAGTSAGLAIQQAEDMVSGGADIHNAWKFGAFAGYDLARDGRDALTHIPAGGLGIFPEALLDSHFSEWGRHARSIRLAHSLGRSLAVGVDEHTALVYDRDTRVAEVIGDRGVSILNLDGCEVPDADESAAGSQAAILGTRWSYLVPGDTHDFASAATTRGTRVADLAFGSDVEDSRARDIWSDDGSRPLLALAERLLDSDSLSASGESSADRQPRYRTSLHRDERTHALATGGFSDLIISITPTPTNH